jgi:S-adenosylmethionine-diacylglycerol 3-amino-3-carboxypropyl transferase
MIAHGRHPIQFKYVDPELNLGAYLWDRFQWAMTTFKIEKNPYMQCFLYGDYFNVKQSIPYLSPSVFGSLKKIASRINIVRADLTEVMTCRSNSMPNKFYLSNVFEYVSEESALCTLDTIGRLGAQNATACYWNFLVSRGAIQASKNHSMQTDFALSSRLSMIDRSWIYKAFWVSGQRRR